MVARVVVLGEVDVVLPEQVIGNQALAGMQHGSEIAKRKELCGCCVHAGGEALDDRELARRRRPWRVERQGVRILAARLVEPSRIVELDAAGMCLGRRRRRLRETWRSRSRVKPTALRDRSSRTFSG